MPPPLPLSSHCVCRRWCAVLHFAFQLDRTLAGPIDVFGDMGGVADWRNQFPPSCKLDSPWSVNEQAHRSTGVGSLALTAILASRLPLPGRAIYMSIIGSSRTPRLPQLQPLSARYNLIQKKSQKICVFSNIMFIHSLLPQAELSAVVRQAVLRSVPPRQRRIPQDGRDRVQRARVCERQQVTPTHQRIKLCRDSGSRFVKGEGKTAATGA